MEPKDISEQLEEMTAVVLRVAKGFTTRELYNYRNRLNQKDFYAVMVDALALIEVFELDEFTVDHFNMAAVKNNQPRLGAPALAVEETAQVDKDEEEDEEPEVVLEEGAVRYSLGVRILTLISNLFIGILMILLSEYLLRDILVANIEGYSVSYVPIIIAVVVVFISLVTVASWYSAEIATIRYNYLARHVKEEHK